MDGEKTKKREEEAHLWLVTAELTVRVRQTLETDGELDVTRADDVLDLELGELGVEAKLLDNTRILARRQTRVIFGLGTRDDHLARREDERRGLRVTNTHDDGGETLERSTTERSPTASQ